MSATTAMLILFVVWIVIGMVAAIVMGRRGHRPFGWMALGVVLGPLIVPVMLAGVRREEPAPTSGIGIADPAMDYRGIDILFGFDGSEESRGALVTAIALLGPHLRRVTIATVLGFDPSSTDRAAAQAQLDDIALLAAGMLDRRPDIVTLVGRPDEALSRYAREQGVALLVIAPRGRGATRALLGSVASRLVRAPDVAVAIMPPATRVAGIGSRR
jgi:nucleotide-binding universal stress UspA family protein